VKSGRFRRRSWVALVTTCLIVVFGGIASATPREASPAVKITTAHLAGAATQRHYFALLGASGCSPSCTWSVSPIGRRGSGRHIRGLPKGLSFSPDGYIVGVPSTAGTARFEVKATNGHRSATRTLVIAVASNRLQSVAGRILVHHSATVTLGHFRLSVPATSARDNGTASLTELDADPGNQTGPSVAVNLQGASSGVTVTLPMNPASSLSGSAFRPAVMEYPSGGAPILYSGSALAFDATNNSVSVTLRSSPPEGDELDRTLSVGSLLVATFVSTVFPIALIPLAAISLVPLADSAAVRTYLSIHAGTPHCSPSIGEPEVSVSGSAFTRRKMLSNQAPLLECTQSAGNDVDWILSNNSGTVLDVTPLSDERIVHTISSGDVLTDAVFDRLNESNPSSVLIPPGGGVMLSVSQAGDNPLSVTVSSASALGAFLIRQFNFISALPDAVAVVKDLVFKCGIPLVNSLYFYTALSCLAALAPDALKMVKHSSKLVEKLTLVLAAVSAAVDGFDTLQDSLDLRGLGNMSADLAFSPPTVNSPPTTVGSKNDILIFGDNDPTDDNDSSGMDNLAAALTADGYNVTEESGIVTPPADLSPYGQVWDYDIESAQTSDEAQLEQYVQNGGSLYLSGEWGGLGNFDNSYDQDVISDLIGAPTIVDDSSGADDVLPVNASALDNFSTSPNQLSTLASDDFGGITGVDPSNVLFTNDDGDAAAAAWPVGTTGFLAIVMDVNWAQSSYGDPTTMPEVAQNIAALLSK
jgi:hypothetical protein